MSNDITIVIGVLVFMLLVGAAIPFVNSAFTTTYTTTVNGTSFYNSITGDPIDCNKWYQAKFIDTYGVPFGSSVAAALNYGTPINYSVNNTGFWGLFQNFGGMVGNFFAQFYNSGLYSGGYNASNYTLMNFTDADAANLGLPPCPKTSGISFWNVLGSMISMLFWTFGGVAWYIDLFIFIPLRLLVLLLLVRNIRGVGA